MLYTIHAKKKEDETKHFYNGKPDLLRLLHSQHNHTNSMNAFHFPARTQDKTT